jgi:RNA polymerase sigma factor (sigma-70 family)
VSSDVDGGAMPADDVVVLPPLPADPLFIDAVDEAISGVDAAALPDAQPQRRLNVDPRDFASLYIRHRSSFALHARRFLHDPRDVDEVLQEAFLRLFLALPELDTELQALAYCRRTVTNLCIDRYRADQRRPRLVDLESMDFDPRDDAPYDDPVLRAEDAAIVREALALLSPLHRAALVKREIEEKPLAQIAAELDIPEASVKHLLFRARRSLRRLLVGTSVEPGAELSPGEALRLANKRLGAGVLKGANVLIVMFVAVVTVVGAVRATTAGDRGSEEAVAGPAQSVTPGGPSASIPAPVSHPRPPHAHVAASRPRATHVPGRVAHVVFSTTKPKPVATSAAKVTTVTKPVTRHHPAVGVPTVVQPLAPTYRISAPALGVTSAPATVNTDTIEKLPTGEWSNKSNFIASTPAGVFTLQQAVQQSTQGVVSANMSASVPLVTGTIADRTLTSSVSTSSTNGLVTVNVTLDVAPNSVTQSETTTPFTINVNATYSSGVTRVLDETVTVTEGSVPCCTSSTPSPSPPNSDTPSGVTTPSGSNGSIGSAEVSNLTPTWRGDQLPLSSSLLVSEPAAVG